MFLAADIGGTKTIVALGDAGGIRFQRRLGNDDHAGPAALIASFLQEAQAAGLQPRVEASCLALAGPVPDGARCAALTNRDWQVDATDLERKLPLGPVALLNDFAAGAAGIASLQPSELVALQAGTADAAAPRLAVGPGTGLGVALALPQKAGPDRILASEGGHVGFAPADAAQQGLLDFLRRQTGGHVSAERVVSGSGLQQCYRYCVAAQPDAPALDQAEISARALAGSDLHCMRALDLFLAVFGAHAGDMALCFLARGGVFLLGGIVPKILPRLRDGPFLAAFGAKAEHAPLMAAMPVHAVLAEDIALRGALAIAVSRG